MLNFIKASMYHFTRYCGFLSALVVYYVKSQNGETLRAGTVFSILGSFGFISLFIAHYIGSGITLLAEFKTTLKRTASILLLEEKGDALRTKSAAEKFSKLK